MVGWRGPNTRKPKKDNNQYGFPPGPLFGCQWGEPRWMDSTFDVTRAGEDLVIRAARPRFLEKVSPHDAMAAYLRCASQRPGDDKRLDAPHIRFANATTDEELIAFVRQFGPVDASESYEFPGQFLSLAEPIVLPDGRRQYEDTQHPIEALQNLRELRREREIYAAALGLLVEQRKEGGDFDFDGAQKLIAYIAERVKYWPRQWRRERKLRRAAPPAWRIEAATVKKIAALATAAPTQLVNRQYFAQAAICELVNVFPTKIYVIPEEMNGALTFGIRPVLYGILFREFLSGRAAEMCATPECRNFFMIGHGRQHYCSNLCARRSRQKKYWQKAGKLRRQKRQATTSASLSPEQVLTTFQI